MKACIGARGPGFGARSSIYHPAVSRGGFVRFFVFLLCITLSRCTLALLVKVGYPPGGAVGYHILHFVFYFFFPPLAWRVGSGRRRRGKRTRWASKRRDGLGGILGVRLHLIDRYRRIRTPRKKAAVLIKKDFRLWHTLAADSDDMTYGPLFSGASCPIPLPSHEGCVGVQG